MISLVAHGKLDH